MNLDPTQFVQSRKQLELLWGVFKNDWDANRDFYVNEFQHMNELLEGQRQSWQAHKETFTRLREMLDDEHWTHLVLLFEHLQKTIADENQLRLDQALDEVQRIAVQKKAVQKAKHDIVHALQNDYLSTDEIYREQCAVHLTKEAYLEIKHQFVRDRLKQIGIDQTVSDEQLAAIASTTEHILLTARAGSGKTKTLVNRALFLHLHCKVPVGQILVLAFNSKAALEIRERIERHDVNMPHVMTFHALAHALVHPKLELVADTDNAFRQSEVVQAAIKEFARQPQQRRALQSFMLRYHREDWTDLVFQGGDHLDQEQRLAFMRSLKTKGLDGRAYKSYGERCVANFLFEHNLEYKYEKFFEWDERGYRPDFTLESCGLIIEYFGVLGDPDYDKERDQKRKYWLRNQNYRLLELEPKHIKSNEFEGLIREALMKRNVTIQKLNDDEVINRIDKEHPKDTVLLRFTKLMTGFIGRLKKTCLEELEMLDLLQSRSVQGALEKEFLDLVPGCVRLYEQALIDGNKDDFDGLMLKACNALNQGKTHFENKAGVGDLASMRFVLIDEYQDFSNVFDRLIQAVRQHNPEVKFFCVGDNWQAINGFAGSDLQYFSFFDQHFNPALKLQLTTNYRSVRKVVAVGNDLMKGFGTFAQAYQDLEGQLQLVRLTDGSIQEVNTPKSISRHHWLPALINIIGSLLEKHSDILLLTRTQKVKGYVVGNKSEARLLYPNEASVGQDDEFDTELRKYFPDYGSETGLRLKTAHTSKGLEADVVIVLDANETSYPLIHQDWVFNRVFGETLQSIVDAERRLFYVALTRARQKLIVITDSDPERQSIFLKDIRHWFEQVDSTSFPKNILKDHVQVEVWSETRFEKPIRDGLKKINFKFNGRTARWSKLSPETEPQKIFGLELYRQLCDSKNAYLEISNASSVLDSFQFKNGQHQRISL